MKTNILKNQIKAIHFIINYKRINKILIKILETIIK